MKKSFHHLRLTLFFLFLAHLSYATNTEKCVSFSAQGGFYDNSFYLALSCPQDLTIHYTLNGNQPTFHDKVYRQPLFLNEKLYSNSDIYTIQTCPDETWFVPDVIQKCIVIRAAAFDENGNRVGPVTTNSYFIKSLESYPSNLPIVSLCADSTSLFGFEEGILLQEGAHNNSLQHGMEWERLCNVEFYEHDNSGINQQAGLRMHGNFSRYEIQKGMKIYARKEYGQKRFCHPFFDDIRSYKNLVLKPMKDGLFSDHVCTSIAQSLNFETPQSRPVVLFLNGEYWGMYFLKERPNERFISDHYGFNKESINIIESWSGKTSCGSNENFINMIKWFLNADLSNTDEYEQACRLIDVNCFIDYYCFQLFVANNDWPDNNMRCWQAKDGKWRWIFFDGDCAMTSYPDMLANTLYNNENKTISTLVFTKLLGNEEFRNHLYERFGKLLTNEFDFKSTIAHFTNCINAIYSEMDFHFQRFGYIDQKEKFDFQIRCMHDFLSYRMVSAAAMVYRLYYYNGWKFTKLEPSSKEIFKYNENNRRPVFLFRMARQFKDWNYVKMYYKYEYLNIKVKWKSSRMFRWMKSHQK